MNNSFNHIWRFFERHPVLHTIARPVLRPFAVYMFEKEKEHKNKVFQDHALEALQLFDECMERIGVRYTLAFGSILGAIREHGFIKHDLDIDTAVWIDDYSPSIAEELERAGFVWVFETTVDNGRLGREETFEYCGVRIDIFYFYPAYDDYPYCCDFVIEKGMRKDQRLPRRIEIPYSRKRKKVQFETIEVYVPENAEEICEFRYGPDYMTPNPSWNWVSSKQHVVEWREKIGVTLSRKYPHGKK